MGCNFRHATLWNSDSIARLDRELYVRALLRTIQPFARHASVNWILNPEKMNEISIGQDGIVAFDDLVSESDIDGRAWHPRYGAPTSDPPSIAISPVISNARMSAQRSMFTLSGDSFAPLDEQQSSRLVTAGVLQKIELQPESYDEIAEFLHISRLTPFAFFPDLEGYRLEHLDRTERVVSNVKDFLRRQREAAQGDQDEGPPSAAQSNKSDLRASRRKTVLRKLTRRS